MSAPFEADLCPETGNPRIRFNFPHNGWSASVYLHAGDARGTRFAFASVAACPTGEWDTGKTEIIGTEMASDEVAHWLVDIAMRRPA